MVVNLIQYILFLNSFAFTKGMFCNIYLVIKICGVTYTEAL